MRPAPPSATIAGRTDALPPRVQAAVDSLHALLAREFGREVERMVGALHRELFEQGEQSRSTQLQAYWMGNLERLVENRQRLLPAWLDGLRASLSRLRVPPEQTRDEPEPLAIRAEDLRLVDEIRPDETSLIDTIAHRHESRAGLPLMLLCQRFGVMAAAPAFEASQLPVGPRALSEQLMEASAVLRLDDDARRRLLMIFDRLVLPGYPELAEAMNAALDRAGVLPGLSFVPLRPRAASSSAPPPPAQEPQRDAAATAAGSPGASPGTPAAAPAPASGRYVGWPLGDDPAPPLREDQRLAQMNQWLAERRQLLARLAGEPSSETAPAALDGEDLQAALAALQQREAPLRSTTGLRQALLDSAREQGRDARLSAADSDALALFGALFSGLEAQTVPDAHGVLGRLQVPLLRRALEDPGVLIRRNDPARQLLGTVAEAGDGAYGDHGLGRDVLQHLARVVEQVARQYPEAPGALAEAVGGLRQALQGVVKRAEIGERRHVEAARGREKLYLARQRAAHAIASSGELSQAPKFLAGLVEQAWADALALVAIREDSDSPQWQVQLDATRAIMAAITRGEPTTQAQREVVERGLSRVGYHEQEAAAIAAYLTGHQGTEGQHGSVSRTELAMLLKARERLGSAGMPSRDDAPRAPAGPRERELREKLMQVPEGSWFDFVDSTRPGGVRRLRLAWRGEHSGRVLLVDAQGHPPQDTPAADVATLARLLANGGAHMVEPAQARLLDRVWRAMVDDAGVPGTGDGTAPKAGGEAGW